MPIIHRFEEHNFASKQRREIPIIINKKRQGNGFADILPSITNFIGNNKDLISNVAKTTGSIADASSKVTQAVKAAKELNQLKEIQKSNEGEGYWQNIYHKNNE